jgi:hypothetical protein
MPHQFVEHITSYREMFQVSVCAGADRVRPPPRLNEVCVAGCGLVSEGRRKVYICIECLRKGGKSGDPTKSELRATPTCRDKGRTLSPVAAQTFEANSNTSQTHLDGSWGSSVEPRDSCCSCRNLPAGNPNPAKNAVLSKNEADLPPCWQTGFQPACTKRVACATYEV